MEDEECEGDDGEANEVDDEELDDANFEADTELIKCVLGNPLAITAKFDKT